MTKQLVVVSAGLSQPSSTRMLADQIASAVEGQVSARGEAVDVAVIELRELAAGLATAMTTGVPTDAVRAARDQVSAADGLVAVTPTFAASYSGLFKTFFDLLDPDSLNGMPTIVAATAGTPRHSLVLDHALRPLLTYLRAFVVPTGVFAATDDFGGGEGGASLAARVKRAAGELADLMLAQGVDGFTAADPGASTRRARTSGNDIDTHVTPFSKLLKGHSGRG